MSKIIIELPNEDYINIKNGMSIDILKMRDIIEYIKNGVVISENNNISISNDVMEKLFPELFGDKEE